jgi:hypothetical protein
MVTEPILKHFNQETPITLETDASDYAIGALCSQPDNAGVLHPIGYYSRKLKDPELNYDIHDKELLAIVDGLRKFETYCKSTPHKIKILTDHKNLEYWQSKRDLNLRQARWAERLADYDFVITYRPGKLAGKPDILSRESGDSTWQGEMKHRQNKERVLLPAEVFQHNAATAFRPDKNLASEESQAETLPVSEGFQADIANASRTDAAEAFRAAITLVSDETGVLQADAAETLELQIDHELLQQIKDKMKHDAVMQETIAKLRNGEKSDNKVALGLCEIRDDLLTYDGLIWIPDDDDLRLKILHDYHDSQAAGHPGRAKTLELVSRSFYWSHQ